MADCVDGVVDKGVSVLPKVHMCQHTRCHTMIPFKQRYCDTHAPLHRQYVPVSRKQLLMYQKQYNRAQRDQQANSFYHDSRWMQLRNYVFNRDYATCAACGRTSNTLIADHIIPLRVDKNKALDASNIWLLCRSCHPKKTEIEEQILKKPNGLNIIKHISKANWIKYINERKAKRK